MGYGAGGGGGDPNFANVVLLCHFDGSNGSTTFTDSGPGGLDPTASAGTPTITTSQSVFGGASLEIGSGDLIVTPSDVDFTFGNGSFTIEFLFRTATVAAANLFDMRPSGAATHPSPVIYTLSTGEIAYYNNGATEITSAAGVITANTWHAIAYARNATGPVGRLFVDGVQVGSWADGQNYTSTEAFVSSWTGAAQGFYDELRLTKGVVRYTGNYTPAAAAFPDF